MLQNDDLLFVRSNGNKELIGRCMIIHVGNREVSYSGFTIRARLKSNRVLPRFLVQLFRTIYIKRQIQTVGGGTNISNLSQSILSDLIIPIPPLPEQRKIVDILNTWDKAIALLEQLITAKRKLKQGLMQQLLTGKRRFKELEDNKSLDMIPESWKQKKLGDLIVHTKGYAFDSGKFQSSGVRVIRISDTTRNSISQYSGVFISKLDSENLGNFILETGDIILTTVGSRPPLYDSMVGKAVRVPPEVSGSLLNQNLVKIAPKDSNFIIQDFLYNILKSQKFIDFIGSLIRGNANQVSITLKELFNFQLELPTLPEQQKIASILSTADAEISTLEKQLATYKQQKRGLMQQLLTGKKRVKIDKPQMQKV